MLLLADPDDVVDPDHAAHHARCGTCRRWLSVTETELLVSLDASVTCWPCDTVVATARGRW